MKMQVLTQPTLLQPPPRRRPLPLGLNPYFLAKKSCCFSVEHRLTSYD